MGIRSPMPLLTELFGSAQNPFGAKLCAAQAGHVTSKSSAAKSPDQEACRVSK
jgi:hypothetical protein